MGLVRELENPGETGTVGAFLKFRASRIACFPMPQARKNPHRMAISAEGTRELPKRMPTGQPFVVHLGEMLSLPFDGLSAMTDDDHMDDIDLQNPWVSPKTCEPSNEN